MTASYIQLNKAKQRETKEGKGEKGTWNHSSNPVLIGNPRRGFLLSDIWLLETKVVTIKHQKSSGLLSCIRRDGIRRFDLRKASFWREALNKKRRKKEKRRRIGDCLFWALGKAGKKMIQSTKFLSCCEALKVEGSTRGRSLGRGRGERIPALRFPFLGWGSRLCCRGASQLGGWGSFGRFLSTCFSTDLIIYLSKSQLFCILLRFCLSWSLKWCSWNGNKSLKQGWMTRPFWFEFKYWEDVVTLLAKIPDFLFSGDYKRAFLLFSFLFSAPKIKSWWAIIVWRKSSEETNEVFVFKRFSSESFWSISSYACLSASFLDLPSFLIDMGLPDGVGTVTSTKKV